MGERIGKVGRYELRDILGVGGFATVFRAYDPHLDRDIALKVLHPEHARDPIARRRFLREWRALGRTRDSNIVQIHDAGEVDGTAYLAMELIDGRTLKAVVSERGPMPLADVVEIADQIASALAALHARGFVHRDINPANIMIEADSGRALLLDLGITRRIDTETVTVPGWVVGTVPFMAPEQLAGRPATAQTDVYQLGATVYALLTGHPPFEGDVEQVLEAIMTKAPPDLGELRPDLPDHAVAVVMEAMAKNPARRPDGARECAGELRGAAGPGSPSAGQPDPPDTIRVPLRPLPSPPVGQPDQPDMVPVPPGPLPAPPSSAHRPLWRRLAVAGAGVALMLLRVSKQGSTVSGRLAVAGAGVALALVTGVAALLGIPGRGTDAETDVPPSQDNSTVTSALSPSLTPSATPSPSPSPTPTLGSATVSDLKVIDNVNDKREGHFEVGQNVVACFTLKPGANPQLLSIVVTPGVRFPQDANDPSIIARADAVPQRTDCFPLAVSKRPLPPGVYRLSVFQGSSRLQNATFVAKGKQGDLLLTDSFDDPLIRTLPTSSPDPTRYLRGYQDGEYAIQQVTPKLDVLPSASIPGRYEDATIIVDARLVGETNSRYIAVACRESAAGHYRLVVDPSQGRYRLNLVEGSTSKPLVDWQQSVAIKRGNETNRLELNCAGSNISIVVNGVPVRSVQNSVHRTGGMWIGAGTFSDASGAAEGRFDNLTVVQRE